MAFSLPTMPAPSGPLLFQPGLSLAARRAQLKTGTKPKKPSLALTLDLSNLPSKPSESRFPNQKVPPVLPGAVELAMMTPRERQTIENTVFNFSLGKKQFDGHDCEVSDHHNHHHRGSSGSTLSTDQDDNESVVSLVHSSNAPSAASSTISTPSSGKSVLENGNFAAQLNGQCEDAENVDHHGHHSSSSNAQPLDLSTDCGSFQVKTTATSRRRTRSESDRSVRWAKSRRTVAFVCASSQHVFPTGEGGAACKCVDCGEAPSPLCELSD